jgi:hypothetical protein
VETATREMNFIVRIGKGQEGVWEKEVSCVRRKNRSYKITCFETPSSIKVVQSDQECPRTTFTDTLALLLSDIKLQYDWNRFIHIWN